MAWMCDSAMKIATWLEQHPKVAAVNYPGLKNNPYHDIATRTMNGYGAMISFELKGGMEAGRKLMDGIKLCSMAVSLGHADTLIQHPASMTHWYTSKEDREKTGITDGLIRLAVGLEGPEDIIADLDQAMRQV
jgi:methionine-gamma-lyase